MQQIISNRRIKRPVGVSLLFFLVFIAFGFSYGQDFQANAKLDTNRMLIGDQTNLQLNFKFPFKSQVQWPVIKDTILGYIQVLNRSAIDSTVSKDKKWLTLHQSLRITSFDSGMYTIPPIRFYFRGLPDTTLHYCQTEPLILDIHTVRVDTSQAIKPIKGPMKVPITFRELLPWLLLAVVAGLIIWFVFYYLKKRKKAEPLFQIKPRIVLQPHELALTELEKLRTKKLWQDGKVKEYHTEVTEIIRRYIEGRYAVMALESTTDEILHDLSGNSDLPARLKEQLLQMLTLADLVKFAKAQPLPDENEQSLQRAIDFVNATIPRIESHTPEQKAE
jgi:hypothetical protein